MLELLARILDRSGSFYRHHGLPQQHPFDARSGVFVEASSLATGDWRAALCTGSCVDAWHEKLRTWCSAQVSDVSAAGLLKLEWSDGIPASITAFFKRTDPMLAPAGTHALPPAALAAQPWRQELTFDSAVDFMEPSGRWCTARIVDLRFEGGCTALELLASAKRPLETDPVNNHYCPLAGSSATTAAAMRPYSAAATSGSNYVYTNSYSGGSAPSLTLEERRSVIRNFAPGAIYNVRVQAVTTGVSYASQHPEWLPLASQRIAASGARIIMPVRSLLTARADTPDIAHL